VFLPGTSCPTCASRHLLHRDRRVVFEQSARHQLAHGRWGLALRSLALFILKFENGWRRATTFRGISRS
jgi:hypothetical protein